MKEFFFSAEGEEEAAECRASVTSDLWECQQVSEPKENTAAVATLNQPQRLTSVGGRETKR